MAVAHHHARIFVVVEAARLHLLCEGHEVRHFTKVPLLVRPERSCLAHTCLHLVDDKENAQLFADVLKTLGKLCRDLVVATLAHNRFNDDSADLAALLIFPLLDELARLGE